MANKRTIQVILSAREEVSKAAMQAKAAIGGFVGSIPGMAKAAIDSLFTLKNAIIGAGLIKVGQIIMKPSIQLEGYRLQLATLMGGMDLAKAKIAELEKFAADTPFELPALVQATKYLQQFGGEALNNQRILTLVGDAASVTAEKDIAGLAFWVGRAYDALKNGQKIGEAASRLQELSVISGETRAEMESLQESGASGATVFGVLTAALGKNKGAMADLSQSAGGLISTLSDAWSKVLTVVGDEVLPELKDAIRDIIKTLEELQASGELKEFGKDAAGAVKAVVTGLLELVRFISANRELLTSLGVAAGGAVLINQAAGAVRKLRDAVQALAAVKAGVAMAELGAGAKTAATSATMLAGQVGVLEKAAGVARLALTNLNAVAITAFAGWNIGKALYEIDMVKSAVDDLAFALTGMGDGGQSRNNALDLELSRRTYARENDPNYNRRKDQQTVDAYDEQQRIERAAAAKDAAERKAADADRKRIADRQALEKTMAEAELNGRVASEAGEWIQELLQDELDKRREAETRRRAALEQLAAMRIQHSRELQDKLIAARLADIARQHEAERKAEAEQMKKTAELRDKAEAAKDVLKMSPADRRRQVRDERDAQRDADRQGRRDAQAYDRAKEAQRAGIPLTQRQKDLIEAGDAELAARRAEGGKGAGNNLRQLRPDELAKLGADADAKAKAAEAARLAREEQAKADAAKVEEQRRLADLRAEVARLRADAAKAAKEAGTGANFAEMRTALEKLAADITNRDAQARAANLLMEQVRDKIPNGGW